MSIEAMKEARSVIGTINTGKPHTLTIGGETVYWQREEWARWALDEVLPQLDKAIEEAEKQEPVGINGLTESETSATASVFGLVNTTPQQPNPLTNGQITSLAYDAERDAARYRWLRDVSVPPHNFYISVPDEFHMARYKPHEVDEYIDRAIEAAYGIKG